LRRRLSPDCPERSAPRLVALRRSGAPCRRRCEPCGGLRSVRCTELRDDRTRCGARVLIHEAEPIQASRDLLACILGPQHRPTLLRRPPRQLVPPCLLEVAADAPRTRSLDLRPHRKQPVEVPDTALLLRLNAPDLARQLAAPLPLDKAIRVPLRRFDKDAMLAPARCSSTLPGTDTRRAARTPRHHPRPSRRQGAFRRPREEGLVRASATTPRRRMRSAYQQEKAARTESPSTTRRSNAALSRCLPRPVMPPHPARVPLRGARWLEPHTPSP
jgi:hypothetical protein